MSQSPDFHGVLTELLHRTGAAGAGTVELPAGPWPQGSAEREIFDKLQAAVTRGGELQRQAQDLAVERERQRLAENLHDAVNQSLFSAGLIAEVLPRLWERNPEEGKRALQDLRRLTRSALAEMRILVADLRPSAIIDTEIADLLHLLGNALAGRADIPVTVSITGAGPLPPEVQVSLYRLCQERLGRIARHQGATRVTVALTYGPGEGTMTIVDDGCGFETEGGPPAGEVLAAMRDKAAAIGAKLSVASPAGSGGGTEFTVRWPDLANPPTEQP